MPIYNIPVNYQTADTNEILAALKWNYGLDQGASSAETLAKLKETTHNNLIDIVNRYRHESAVAAALAALPAPIVIT